jgi:hypothetical protein
MKDYHINIFYSEEDEGYIADIPDLLSYRLPSFASTASLTSLTSSTRSASTPPT